eukprot:NODE_30307_length_422_cov_1.857627.p1 GENE.NODE_30307_length_422_cov_1.857627~~NODE_30307_length_422_cov_1.857627.p1  ORF type:complete len:98 (+),score=21.03 NODE_30307_length_422_cov_1.857627:76-369(+)
MADAGKDDAKAESKDEEKEEESGCKLCIFAILDCIGFIVRTIVACFRGILNCIRRTVYPIKEAILAACIRWSKWKQPYRAKEPAPMFVPQFVCSIDP